MNGSKKMMDRAKEAVKSYPKTVISSVITLIVVFYIIKILINIFTLVSQIQLALTPPKLPVVSTATAPPENLNPEGWAKEKADWFRFAPQGAATLPIPYDWFLALEEPKSHPIWAIFGGSEPLFKDEYIYGHGFIKTDQTEYNEDALPIGFTKVPSIRFNGINRHAPALGLTCAACHTGQFTYNKKRYIVDGGPAVIDLGLFGKSLGAALGQTELSGKFFLLNSRFNRFAKRVLGNHDNLISRARLKQKLTATIESLKSSSDVIKVTEGFTRNDALNRIGNQVFSVDMKNPANYHAINAPVTYPHIWTTSWFDWVQYDGSIMQPLVRNAGEALGLKAYLNTTAPDDQRFASSINMRNLDKIENWLSGTNPKVNGEQFNGLKGPKWPASLPSIDKKLASQGKELYEALCASCHLPDVNSAAFWSANHWKPIRYYSSDGEFRQTKDPYLNLNIIPLDDIGTDPSQAGVLQNRTVDSTGLNVDTEVCTEVSFEDQGQIKTAFKYVPLNDSATGNFGLTLGAVVGRTNQQWFSQNYTPETRQKQMEGGRPNCLQVGKGYKARPLNGVWATAPFLHNGSIATLYDLLSPAKDRPKIVELGNSEFDPKKVGIVQSKEVVKINIQLEAAEEKNKTLQLENVYSSDGYFWLDARKHGNKNIGHSFEGEKRKSAANGIVRGALSEEERWALIEYLKSI